jgi:hypothetical protein
MIVRRFELGERLVPCFFGFQHRYEVGESYLVFLKDTEEGLETLRAHPLDGQAISTEPVQRAPFRGELHVSDLVYRTFFSDVSASNAHNPPGEAGTWRITADRVPLDLVLAASADIRGKSSFTPPKTCDAGLR